MHGMIQHTLNPNSGIAADGVVNTFHFQGPDINGAAALVNVNNLFTALHRFYDVFTGAFDSVSAYLNLNALAPARHTSKFYLMDDDPPRLPRNEITTAGGAVGGPLGIPSECAVCLSFKADINSGDVPARHRGRIYIGPLNIDSVAYTATGEPHVHVDFRLALLNAAQRLQQEAAAQLWTWSVYSRTRAALLPIDNQNRGLSPIAEWHVDDAFDTIRSRGHAPLGRSTIATL